MYSRQPTSYLSFYCFWFIQPFSNNEVRFLRTEPHLHLSMLMCKEFSRIVCVSLFSYQGCLSCDSLFTLSHSSVPVKYFFQVFFEAFSMFVCRSQATCLLYHMFVSLSTTIFVFFKTFQIVCSEETILRDSSVRIPL